MKKVLCPNCGAEVYVNGLGRKPLTITVNNVLDALGAHPTIQAAAFSLGCSRGFIYKILNQSGIKMADVRK